MFNREYSWMTHPLKGFTSTPIIQVRKKWIIVVDNLKVDKTKTFRDAKNEIDNFGIMTSFYSIRQLGCILSTFMHRRHLMVWNVFAPRLLFEIAEFLVFLIFCFLILSTNVSIICSLEKGAIFIERSTGRIGALNERFRLKFSRKGYFSRKFWRVASFDWISNGTTSHIMF